MNKTEKDLINRLFDKIGQAAMQPAPRDLEAESLINQKMKEIPGAAYYMAQTLVVQRQALKQAEARIAQLEQHLGLQPGGQGSFLAYQNGYGRQQGYYDQPQQFYDNRGGFGGGGFGGGGFLAGAAQTALGVAGGVLLANAAVSLFDGFGHTAGGLFNDNPVDTFSGNGGEFQSDPGAGSSDGSGDFDQGSDIGEGGGFFDGGGDSDW